MHVEYDVDRFVNLCISKKRQLDVALHVKLCGVSVHNR
jgi:hypothetical protein